VFVRTKRGADRLAAKLRDRGITVAAMHGDLSQQQRERTLVRFRAGKISTLVATDVAARGLDVEGIEHVVNYDPPRTTPATCTVWAGRPAPAPPGRASRWSRRSSRATSAAWPPG
jgi:superfamily II DNA/RNA helicase